ncbi:MAG: sigma-70 family RNA polymerase sigma factor [Clostridiales bacterium]|nr:sigma-70 family RNA polymerase sigma factor [Clostridiales bacterium]
METKLNRDEWLEAAMLRWEVPLLRTCFLLLRDRSLAEDAVQQTFLKAWRGYDSFRGDSSEKTWLSRIAVHTCRDIQREKWFRRIDLSVGMEELPEPAEGFREPDDTVTRAILALPDQIRRAVALHYYQGLTVQETAQALGISRRTAHYRLEKAYRLLKEGLEGWYHDA